MGIELSRRAFLAAAAVAGAAVAVPPALRRMVSTAAGGDALFLEPLEYDTCAAICGRIVPGSTVGVVFVDRFLAGPGVYLAGPYSGRNPYPDPATGQPSTNFPSPIAGYLDLSPAQKLTWSLILDGPAALDAPPSWADPTWVASVRSGELLAAAPSLRQTYHEGLAAFNQYSMDTFGVRFADATPEQQDAMLELAGNIVLSPFPFPSPPAAPEAAKALFPHITVHTFQACYGLPEYRGTSDASTTLWAAIGWDGDTQPLGNTIYWDNAHGPGQGPNHGFGMPGVYEPRGGYREYRPVSTFDGGDGLLATEADLTPIAEWLRQKGAGR